MERLSQTLKIILKITFAIEMPALKNRFSHIKYIGMYLLFNEQDKLFDNSNTIKKALTYLRTIVFTD